MHNRCYFLPIAENQEISRCGASRNVIIECGLTAKRCETPLKLENKVCRGMGTQGMRIELLIYPNRFLFIAQATAATELAETDVCPCWL